MHGVLMLLSLTAAEVQFGGKRVHYTNHGKGREAVILVHGWTCDETFWKHQVPALAVRHRVITVDLPGHGKSEVPLEAEMTMDNFARAIHEVMRAANVTRAVLAGHSMGTPVIRQFARLFPAETRALILVDGTIFPPREAMNRQGRGLLYRGESGRKARLLAVRSYFGAATSPDVREHIERVMMNTAEATAAGAIDGMLSMNVWSDESPVNIPVLAVYAGTPGVPEEYLRKLFPRMQYHKVAGTGHFLMLEKPSTVNALIARFLHLLSHP
jgi:pimeloyl-ACP methyl ester carboxylesterase